MGSMERLVKEMEQQISAIHGFSAENKMVKQSSESYTVKYDIGGGAICIIATASNSLNISVLAGPSLAWDREVYSSPFVSDPTIAKKMLDFIERALNDCGYFAYNVEITDIAKSIEQEFSRYI